jgi:DNA replication and repair protein RecF
MNIATVELKKFRSYQKTRIDFSPSVTLIVGPNTAGKTNILEAIASLSVGKSFRAEKESDMVQWGEEVGRIVGATGRQEDDKTGRPDEAKAMAGKQEDETKLELIITTGVVNGEKAPTKKYLVNGVPRRQIDFVGNLRAVLFSPEDLDLVTDSPSLRRQYLNTVLIQTDREYRRNLFSYERGLRQRNKLLDLIQEGKASRSQLLFWNQLLIQSGSYITEKRAAYIEFVNESRLMNFAYKIEYDKSIISQSRLDQYKDEEVAAKTTLVGPQRDDIRFEKKEGRDDEWKDISRFGSRGEQRMAVLWVKLAELSYIEASVGERPILLLDDIFSELDDTSRGIVLSIIYKQQTIITSAEEDVVELFDNLKDVKTIRLEG